MTHQFGYVDCYNARSIHSTPVGKDSWDGYSVPYSGTTRRWSMRASPFVSPFFMSLRLLELFFCKEKTGHGNHISICATPLFSKRNKIFVIPYWSEPLQVFSGSFGRQTLGDHLQPLALTLPPIPHDGPRFTTAANVIYELLNKRAAD